MSRRKKVVKQKNYQPTAYEREFNKNSNEVHINFNSKSFNADKQWGPDCSVSSSDLMMFNKHAGKLARLFSVDSIYLYCYIANENKKRKNGCPLSYDYMGKKFGWSRPRLKLAMAPLLKHKMVVISKSLPLTCSATYFIDHYEELYEL